MRPSKYKGHYLPELIVCAYIIHASSAAAYEVFVAQSASAVSAVSHSVSTLARITRLVNSNSGLDNASYLQLRVSKMNDYQKNVLIIIDEIYIAKRVELGPQLWSSSQPLDRPTPSGPSTPTC